MTQATPSRRRILQMLSGMPMLPLSSALAGSSVLLTACGGGTDTAAQLPAATLQSVSFSSMAAPSSVADMATTSVASTMTVTLSDGSKEDFALAYEAFFITGDLVPDGSGNTVVAGGYYDINNQPIMDTTVPARARQYFSDAPDGTSLLAVANPTVSGIKGKAVFAVVQFEYTSLAQDGATDMYGKLPSPIAVLTLDQDQSTGQLTLVKYHNLDTSSVHGLWITCGASLSPWGTHLSSEEYEPDAYSAATNTGFQAFIQNLYGDVNASADPVKANPYHYGHMPEVTVNPDGTGSIKKHYCMGRISHELVQVMPDNRTVLHGDDTTNGGLFVFVADKEKDLSAGTLYVAKVGAGFSLDTAAATGAPLSWIKLGSATSAEIKTLAETRTLAQIMTVSKTDPADASFTKIFLNGKAEWVKLVPGEEKAAAFLETHRYAALVGASMGFTKMEGTTLNIADKVAYSALSACGGSMVKSNASNAVAGGVGIDAAVNAGAVMALALAGGQIDDKGGSIDSEWMPVDIKALLVGEDIAKDAMGNTANPDKIGNPDNLKFSEKMRTLFIGEDSGMHVNNFLWAYNVDTKVLSRVMSTPAGAESTGLHAVDELNGWTYVMSNFQHAGDRSGLPAGVEAAIKANYKDKYGAAVGYLTGKAAHPKLA